MLNSNKGFSLVELMVSVLVGVVVLAGVVQVVINSKRSYMDNQDISFIQDNTRYAVSMMGQDIRLAGYRGCASKEPVVANVLDLANADLKAFVAPELSRGFRGVEGFANSAPAVITGQTANTDAIVVRYGGFGRETMITEHSGTTIKSPNHGFSAGQPLMIVDANCSNAGVFTASSIAAGAVLHAESTYNCKSKLKGNHTCDQGAAHAGVATYTPGSALMPFNVVAYFIGPSGIDPNMPALKRASLGTLNNGTTATLAVTTEELAIGVETLKIEYGLANASGLVTQFVAANAVTNWEQVGSVRVTIKFIGQLDPKLNKEIVSTIQIRNRV